MVFWANHSSYCKYRIHYIAMAMVAKWAVVLCCFVNHDNVISMHGLNFGLHVVDILSNNRLLTYVFTYSADIRGSINCVNTLQYVFGELRRVQYILVKVVNDYGITAVHLSLMIIWKWIFHFAYTVCRGFVFSRTSPFPASTTRTIKINAEEKGKEWKNLVSQKIGRSYT